MVTIIRDRVQDLMKKGMTLDQVQAAEPAQGYARRYGADSGPGRRRCSSRRFTTVFVGSM